ncbi:MotA/TolQ/ExbB proton channel family protein [Psychromonas sp. KJ10-10]
MIETFQVMTQYGNSDPKLMAEGISTALVTTVLGLIAKQCHYCLSITY